MLRSRGDEAEFAQHARGGHGLCTLRQRISPSAVSGNQMTTRDACTVVSQETRQQARNGEGGLLTLAASVAGCILECFYTLIEYLTKFATVMMSITGTI